MNSQKVFTEQKITGFIVGKRIFYKKKSDDPDNKNNSENDIPCVIVYGIRDSAGFTNEYSYYPKNFMSNTIDEFKQVTITYKTVRRKTYENRDILSVEYVGYITHNKFINERLVKDVGLTHQFVKKIFQLYDNNVCEMVFDKTDELSNIKHNNIESLIDNIKKYQKNNAPMKLITELIKLGINKQYYSIINEKIGNIDNVKEDIFKLYFECGVPFKMCNSAGIIIGTDKNHPNRINAFIDFIYKEFYSKGEIYVDRDELLNKRDEHEIEIDIDNVISKLVSMEVDDTVYHTSTKNDDTEDILKIFVVD